MVIVKLDGGMGNQLFQYAAGKYLATKLRTKLKMDVDRYLEYKEREYSLRYFNIQQSFSHKGEMFAFRRKEYWRNKLDRIGISLHPYWYTEPSPGYHAFFDSLRGNVYLEGFWQSEKYFKPIEDTIRTEFVVKTPPSPVNENLIREIGSVNAVSIHVRRGDYVSNPVTNAVHGVCDISYYNTAIDRMVSDVKAPVFYIFSDDMAWTKNNLKIGGFPVTYVDHNTTAPHEDLRLMYNCKHHIIANSSFSWWGAWLSKNDLDKKVIAPRKWFQSIIENKDIIPDKWTAI